MHSTWSSTFLEFFHFFKLKMGNLISWGEPILENVWIIWLPLLYFNFKYLKDSYSSLDFDAVLHDWEVLFSGGEWWTNSVKQPNNWVASCAFQFKILKDSNFLSFIRFRCILHDWAVFFSVFFLKWKMKDLISWGQPILQKSNLFGPLSCIPILKIWRTQILRHLLDLNSFYKIQQYFSQFFETSSFFKWKRVT